MSDFHEVLTSIQRELETLTPKLKQARKTAVMLDQEDTENRLSEAIKHLGWATGDVERACQQLVSEDGPEPDGYRQEGGRIVPSSR